MMDSPTASPEPCLSPLKQCFSPIACSVWGYCRERNMGSRTGVTDTEIDERRALAKKRVEGQ